KVNYLNESSALTYFIAELIKSSPKNNAPNPKTALPIAFTFSLSKKNNIKLPIAIIGNEYAPISKPITQAVTVVPTFAQIITPIACLRDIKQALTKAADKSVLPVLLYIKMLTNIPDKNLRYRLLVNLSKISRNLSPAVFCKPSPIYLIPSKNIPRPPIKLNISVCTSSST